MAISYTHYQLLKSLQPLLPRGGSLLEIGEANWYGDINPSVLTADFLEYKEACEFVRRLKAAVDEPDWFKVAKLAYEAIFAPSRIVSVDINGTEAALRHDLNQRLPLSVSRIGDRCYEAFDISINHGTAEHIFNIAQVFRTMHDWTKPGGLMIHEAPCTGWLDHGFYTLQPTLFYDLAAANEYAIELIALEEIASRLIINLEHRDHFAELAQAGRVPMNSMLFVALRRGEGPFRIPMQGYYDQKLSAAGNQAWETLR